MGKGEIARNHYEQFLFFASVFKRLVLQTHEKVFPDNKSKMSLMVKLTFNIVKNIVEEGENAGT